MIRSLFSPAATLKVQKTFVKKISLKIIFSLFFRMKVSTRIMTLCTMSDPWKAACVFVCLWDFPPNGFCCRGTDNFRDSGLAQRKREREGARMGDREGKRGRCQGGKSWLCLHLPKSFLPRNPEKTSRTSKKEKKERERTSEATFSTGGLPQSPTVRISTVHPFVWSHSFAN